MYALSDLLKEHVFKEIKCLCSGPETKIIIARNLSHLYTMDDIPPCSFEAVQKAKNNPKTTIYDLRLAIKFILTLLKDLRKQNKASLMLGWLFC